GDDCVLAATGVTGGTLGRPQRSPGGWSTRSLLATVDHPVRIGEALTCESASCAHAGETERS
ncbi:MAG: hypothetical protein ACRDV9_09020, partial [Acidimicrobiia bacterium]